MSQASIQLHDQCATDYDRQVREYGCFAADILFGLCFEYINPSERLLDVGIGTGLSAEPFAKAGLVVCGIDASPEMLKICEKKKIAVELEQFDIQSKPWPYSESAFDHVICCGVMHFISDLDLIFEQVARVIRPNGIFAFTTKAPTRNSRIIQETSDDDIVFTHSRNYIEGCTADHGFSILKCTRFSIGTGCQNYEEEFFAFAARKRV